MLGVTVRVPATSANLGPGYDSFGLALSIHNQFSAELSDEWTVAVLGEGADILPAGPENRVALAMARVFKEAGEEGQAARVFCTNRIPPGRGLGSSSAAIVGGMMLADALCATPLGRNRLFELAVEMEGHPDNVGAALWGGFTVCWREETGPRCARVEPGDGLAAVIVTSDAELSTAEARALLPESVSHEDAAFGAARAGLLAAGIVLGRADMIGPGLSDRIHEQYRISVVPDLSEVAAALIESGVDGAALSGAGPSVIGLVYGFDDARALRRAGDVAQKAAARLRELGRPKPVCAAVDREGAVWL